MDSLGINFNDFYRGKRVLITGHTGFKGSWLSAILLDLGAIICGVALKPVSNGIYEKINLDNKLESHIVDIRNYEELKKIFEEFKPEIVFHLAAQPLVIDSYLNPSYTYDVNVMGTVNICECIRNSQSVKSFINVTTDKVYENYEDFNHFFKENDRLNGFDPYSNSKSCSELVTNCYKKSFFNNSGTAFSTCRAGNVIGGGDCSANRIIPDCVKFSKEKKIIEIRNPNSIRPYQHVLEADYFYLLLAMRQYENVKLSGSYNIGPEMDSCINNIKLVKIFCDIWGDEANYKIADNKDFQPYEANFLKLDISKSKDILNWEPKLSLKEAIEYTIEWERNNFDSDDLFDLTMQQIRRYRNGD